MCIHKPSPPSLIYCICAPSHVDFGYAFSPATYLGHLLLHVGTSRTPRISYFPYSFAVRAALETASVTAAAMGLCLHCTMGFPTTTYRLCTIIAMTILFHIVAMDSITRIRFLDASTAFMTAASTIARAVAMTIAMEVETATLELFMTTVPSLPVVAQHAAPQQQLVVTQVAQQLLSVLPQALAPGLAHQLHCLILGPQDLTFTQEEAILVHIFSSYQTSEPPPQSIPNFNLSVFLSSSQSSIFEGD